MRGVVNGLSLSWRSAGQGPEPRKSRGQEGGGPKGGPRRVGPEGWGPEGWWPKISRFVSLSRSPFSFFFCLFACLLVEFWWSLERRDYQMCTFGVLGVSCEAPAAPKPPESIIEESCHSFWTELFGVLGGLQEHELRGNSDLIQNHT